MIKYAKNACYIITVFVLVLCSFCTFAQASDTYALTFENPFSYNESFQTEKSPLVSEAGGESAYSQFVTAKYWAGENPENIAVNGGISLSTSKESFSLSATQPVYGSYIFDFQTTHPEFNNLSSAIYIGARSTQQFIYLPDYSIANMPDNGVWLGISHTNVGIGTGLVSGSSSKRFSMGDSFANYTSFRVYDDRENNVLYYYALSDSSSLLFAKAELMFDEASATTNICYTIYADNGAQTETVTVNSLLSADSSEGVYPQLHFNKYLCDFFSFGVTCEADAHASISHISLEGAELSEEISLDTLDYTLKAPVSGTVDIIVNANSGVKYSVFADTEEIPLVYGINTVTISDNSALYILADNGITQTTYTFTIIDNTHTVTVVPTYCSVEGADEDGAKTLVVEYEGTATFTITPDPGYDFVSVSGDAVYSEVTEKTVRTGTLTLENVTEDTVLELVFDKREAIDLTIASATAAQGETIDIPVTISENSGAVAGSFNILYDSERLEFNGPITTGCVSVGNRNLEKTSTEGKLGFYFISKNLGQTPLTAGGVLIYMRFTVKDDAADGEGPLTLSFEGMAGTAPSIDDAEGPRDINITNGVIHFHTPDDGKHILKTAVYNDIGGKVTPGGRLGAGEIIHLTATATTGYNFSHWTAENGSFSSTTAASTSYIMGDGPATAYAHFVLKTYDIITSVENNEGGTISASKDIVDYGGSVEVTLTPYPGYELTGFTVNGKDKLSSVTNGVYTLSSIKNTQTMVATYSWVGTDIITDILPLRAYDVSYSNADRTISVTASNVYNSAGFALTVSGDETLGAYFYEKGYNLAQGVSDGKKYIGARRSSGNLQTFPLYITYQGIEYIYNVTVRFTDDPQNVAITDLAVMNGYSVSLDTINHKATIMADRYSTQKNVGFAFVLPENVKMSYEFISTSDGEINTTEAYSSEYISANGGSYGKLSFIELPITNGLTQKLKVTLSDGTNSNEYLLNILFRNLTYEGDVRPSALLPLRLSSYTIDTETKTIVLEAQENVFSAGLSLDMNGNPPVKITGQSGCGLACGVVDGYRYVVARASYGSEQTFKVKLYGENGYEYSIYTVTIKFN